jgi:hypothetical protein
MYSGLQNGLFENLLIAEYFNCHNDIHSNLHSQISSVVVFNDHDGTVDGQIKLGHLKFKLCKSHC